MSGSVCRTCGRPGRSVLFQQPGGAKFRSILFGNRVGLLECPECCALWCFSRQGLRGAPACGVPWPHGPAEWQRAYDADDGVLLGRWHLATLRDLCRAGQAPAEPPDAWAPILSDLTAAGRASEDVGPTPSLQRFFRAG